MPTHWRYAKTKAALLEYGWPDNFRKDDWVRDIYGLQDKLEEKWRIMDKSLSKQDQDKIWRGDGSWEEVVDRLKREWTAKENELSEQEMNKLKLQDNENDSCGKDVVQEPAGGKP